MSVLNAIKVIRKYGILNRMPQSVEDFKTDVNQLCIKMTHTRRIKDAKRLKKEILRDLKKLTTQIGKHGRKHLEKLESEERECGLSPKQKEYIAERLGDLLKLKNKIIHQAHERIIGDRQVKNKDKILSIYDLDIEVLKRGKAGKEVEFGNKFYISENREGYIIDFTLAKGNPDDRILLQESLDRHEQSGLPTPKSICSDRGFHGGKIATVLRKREIEDNSCPKNIDKLREKLSSPEFVKQQKRRAATEGRIAILKAKFSLSDLRSKGFSNRERSCSWAVLSHNLWIISKQIFAQEEEKQAA